LPEFDKVLFVVDRKDLDYQTMREYDRFEKGAANSNTSTAVLQKQLEDPNARIIITTIQKLERFVANNKGTDLRRPCGGDLRRVPPLSQFGDMHTEITRAFKRYHLFGFTGTPIFAANAGTGGNPQRRTTEQAFGDKLHTYTIVDAINDKNVLPFRIDYVNTIKAARITSPTSKSPPSTPRRRCWPERISQVVELHPRALRPEDQARRVLSNARQAAVRLQRCLPPQVIDAAKRYYAEFERSSGMCPKRSGSRSA
jgi:type I restriction enzyme, R subunit